MFDKLIGLFGKKSSLKFSGNVPGELANLVLPFVRAKGVEELRKEVVKRRAKICGRVSPNDKLTPKKLVRALIYHICASFVHSGELADRLRDSVDDRVWEIVEEKIPADRAADVEFVFDLTLDALLQHLF